MSGNSDAQVSPREIGLAIRTLLQAGRDMHAALARRLGVGETDLEAMDHLVSSSAAIGPVELAQWLKIRSASATVLVDRLEAAGHVRREPHPRDRRRITVQPTDHARAAVRAELDPLLGALAKITSRLDPEQARTVLTFLQETIRTIHEFTSPTLSSTPPEVHVPGHLDEPPAP